MARAQRTVSKRPIMAAGGLAVGLVLLLLSSCSLDIQNPGAITDDSLNDASLMRVVVNGIANEFNTMVEGFAFDNARLGDGLAGTGSYFQTGRLRRGAMDWEETGGDWGQIHETIWTGQQAWGRMTSLEDFDETTSELASRAWMLMGFAHRTFGENFCQVVYSVDFDPELAGPVQPREVAFDSAVVAFNRAITIGTAAGSAGADFAMASRAGLAQAYMGKGDFGQAVTHAQQVPTDFVLSAIFSLQSNNNFVYVETGGRAEGGVFGTYAWQLDSQDPRAPFTICGTFDDPDNPKNSDVTPTNAAGCTSHQGADGVTAHYRQDKYLDEGSDIPVATGVEMRLIEAEAALVSNDLATFTARINDVRTFYGLAAIAQPATRGALEYPNAYDASTGDVTGAGVDGWSILDGERWLTTWLEGRRVWDLHRWNHPFLDGGIVFWDSEARRVSCWPIPEIECTLNDALRGETLLTGLGSETMTCG